MRILVLGGYGFIGRAVMRRLAADGHAPVGLGRSAAAGRHRAPQFDWIGADIAGLLSPADWLPHLSGVDAVVNCSGALQSGGRDRLKPLQHDAMVALFQACGEAGVRRFVQISAPGAAPSAATEFLATKGMADAALRASSLDWIVLKPALVIDGNAYGGTALLRMLAAFPLVLPLVHAGARVGTVSMDDLTGLVARAVLPAFPARQEIDLVEAEPGTLREVVLSVRLWLGYPPPRAVLSLPGWAGSAVGRIADLLAWFGWRSPLRSTALRIIAEEGVGGDPQAFAALNGGAPPRALGETLAGLPATVQERWFARLFLALPLMVAVLALFWLLSGAIGMARSGAASALLADAGFTPLVAMIAVVGGSLADLALGAAVLFRPLARRACWGMVGVSLFYLLAGTLFLPHLWLDPLGPFLKVLPGLVLAWVLSLMLEER
ncbi:SDR family oxidoreductase [Nitratireductor pacificus]|uniref:dTDP-4-dehydrorhamnose reductase n=1 Tax=Nitratireductor pacificus pht-3B TaxID=391937 RepID=K2MZ34_9HYPH|nr:SDR family oxidoreductase [Nitratireductor pacificus]EKF17253.1 dTDP-4-dehydrorhamnose reductase [Nitratireductor pacificus pht-3B]